MEASAGRITFHSSWLSVAFIERAGSVNCALMSRTANHCVDGHRKYGRQNDNDDLQRVADPDPEQQKRNQRHARRVVENRHVGIENLERKIVRPISTPSATPRTEAMMKPRHQNRERFDKPLRRLARGSRSPSQNCSQTSRNRRKEQRIAQATDGLPERKETDECDGDDEQRSVFARRMRARSARSACRRPPSWAVVSSAAFTDSLLENFPGISANFAEPRQCPHAAGSGRGRSTSISSTMPPGARP